MHVQNAEEMANILLHTWGNHSKVELENKSDGMNWYNYPVTLSNGLLITVPNPNPIVLSNPSVTVNDIVQQSLTIAKERGIVGSKLTPFLLSTMPNISKECT